jgi:hypothetical protein
VASIFNVEEEAEQEISLKAGGNQLIPCSVYSSILKM